MIRQDLVLDSPYLNAAGSLGFAPPAGWPLPERMGAFITHPVSPSRRTPAAGRAALPYPGGFILHTGLPNPGLRAVLRLYSRRWAHSQVPIWVHLIPETPDQTAQMIARLENVEGVMAIELSIPPEAPADECLALAAAALGELPLAVSVPLHRVREAWINHLPELGISALTLGAPRGVMLDAGGKPVSGRIYGPALFPQALAALMDLRPLGIPLIAGAGIFRRADAAALLAAGAAAVQIDAAVWKGFLI